MTKIIKLTMEVIELPCDTVDFINFYYKDKIIGTYKFTDSYMMLNDLVRRIQKIKDGVKDEWKAGTDKRGHDFYKKSVDQGL